MSVWEKFKLSRFENLVVLNEPKDYDRFENQSTELSGNHDGIFAFVYSIEDMVKLVKKVINEELLMENGYLFLAYPKKGNKRYDSYIHRDEIFPALEAKDQYTFNSDLKFNQVAKLDDVFTVMTLKRTKKSTKKKTAASQRVSDYEKLVPEIEEILSNHPDEL